LINDKHIKHTEISFFKKKKSQQKHEPGLITEAKSGEEKMEGSGGFSYLYEMSD
jgi:hypothetical protein